MLSAHASSPFFSYFFFFPGRIDIIGVPNNGVGSGGGTPLAKAGLHVVDGSQGLHCAWT